MLKIVIAATATEKEQVVLIHKAKFMENGGDQLTSDYSNGGFVRVDFTLNPDRGCERLVAIVTRSGGKALPSEHLSVKIAKAMESVVYVIDPLRASRQKRTPKFVQAILLGAALETNECGWIVSERLGGVIRLDDSKTIMQWVNDFEDDYEMRAADGGAELAEDSDDEDDDNN